MARVGPLRGVWRRGIAMREVMKGSSLILQQTPHLSSASTSCSSILSSHFQPCRRVRQLSSLIIRHQRQRVLHLYNKLQNGSFCVKHFPSSFHGDARALKQQKPWSKEKFKDAFNLYPTREPTRTVDIESFNRPSDESHRPPRNYPSLVTQLPTALEPQFPFPRVDQSKTRDLNGPGNLDQSTLSSTLEVVQRGSIASCKPLPTVSTISEHRSNLIAQGRLQSRASYGSRDSSRDTAQGNGSTHMHSAATTGEAIVVLQNRLRRGITTDSYTYGKILQMCLKQNDLSVAKQVHDCIIESRMDKNPYLANTLLTLYIRCGAFMDARRVFDKLENKNVITWTTMIAAYAKSDQAESALEVFKLMQQHGARPNEVTYLCILKACTSPLALTWGKQVHECIRHAGFESDVRVGTALLQMYAKCECITEARRVFENLKGDVVTWNSMIGAYAESGQGMAAYRLFLEMIREGFKPNVVTYLSILNVSACAGALEWVKEVHLHASNAGLESNLQVGTALVQMYAESGSLDDARLVFDRMEKRDVVTWTTMLGGLARHGCGHEALALFRKMKSDLVEPNRITFAAALSACCHAGLVDDGRRLFSAIKQEYGIEPDTFHYACMVDLLGRAGHLEEAKRFISDMPVEPNVVIWTALLGACRTYGNVELGELAANELFKLEPSRAATYVLLSNIYAAAGKWKKVSLVRTMMEKRGVRKEPGRSWIEVDSKIHEFVGGDTSHPEAKAIYIELNKLTEKLKAEGYIPDTRHVLHDINEEDKELALCSHSEKLAIAYGLMHIPRGQPIRVRKNLRVCQDCHTATKFISKVTGRDIIARDAYRYHLFRDGVCSCGDYW